MPDQKNPLDVMNKHAKRIPPASAEYLSLLHIFTC